MLMFGIVYKMCNNKHAYVLFRHWDGEVGPPPSRAGSKRFVS